MECDYRMGREYGEERQTEGNYTPKGGTTEIKRQKKENYGVEG